MDKKRLYHTLEAKKKILKAYRKYGRNDRDIKACQRDVVNTYLLYREVR